ncbi:MAG TPA: TonB-dependent receptor, partial [Geobacteraceae bacterium]
MSHKYTESYIEKAFLYLLFLSFLLHVAMFALFYYLPQEKKVAKEEPVMIDLQDLPPSKEAPAGEKKEVKRLGEKRRRVTREMAPKGEMPRERIARLPSRTVPPAAQPPARGVETLPRPPAERGEGLFREKRPGEDLLRRGEPGPPGIARLFPQADKLARLEDSYRKKHGPEVKEGETKFLDTNDIQFGSFLRRFENAVYGVWNYPEEAA